MEKDSTSKVGIGIKIIWAIGWITAILWAVFSTLLITNSYDKILIFDPALIFGSFICTLKYAPLWNQPLSDTIYYCVHCGDSYEILRAISNVLLVGGLTYGVIRKNWICALILLILPFLNFYLAIEIAGLWTGDIGTYILGVIYFAFSVLLFIGLLGTIFYRRAIKAAQNQLVCVNLA